MRSLQVVRSRVRWDWKDLRALCNIFRRELESNRKWCTSILLLSQGCVQISSLSLSLSLSLPFPSLLSSLPSGTDHGYQPSLDEALASLSMPHPQTVQLDKERRDKYTNGVCIEQTDITVQNSSPARGEGGPPSISRWRSVAVEGDREDILRFMSLVKVRSQGAAGREISLGELLKSVAGETRGYAQFVTDLPTI